MVSNFFIKKLLSYSFCILFTFQHLSGVITNLFIGCIKQTILLKLDTLVRLAASLISSSSVIFISLSFAILFLISCQRKSSLKLSNSLSICSSVAFSFTFSNHFFRKGSGRGQIYFFESKFFRIDKQFKFTFTFKTVLYFSFNFLNEFFLCSYTAPSPKTLSKRFFIDFGGFKTA